MEHAVVLDIETTGLNPLDDRITCIGLIFNNEEKIFINKNKKKMLDDFWFWLGQISKDTSIVGFNVYKFDFRFLHLRSMKYGLGVPFSLKERFIDLQYELNFYGRNEGSLHDYAVFIGTDGKIGDGLQAVKLWEDKRYKELAEYCMEDVRLTKMLYERCLHSGIIKSRW